MANIDDNILDALINDPDFRNLSEEEQVNLYHEMKQEITGKIPNSGQLLDRVVGSNPLPFFKGSDVPKVAFQGAQGMVGNAPQNIVENPMMTAMGGPSATQMKAGAMVPTAIGSLFGAEPMKPETTEFSDKYLEPETLGGKIAGTAANIVGGSVIPGMATAKGVSKLFGEKAARRELSDIAFSGADEAKAKVGSVIDEATDAFGRGLDNITETLTKDDFANAISSSIDELGVGAVQNHPFNKALADAMENLPQVLNPREIQQYSKTILRSLGGDKTARAIFYKNLSNVLPDTLKNLKESYAPVFNVMNQGKKITSGSLKRAGSGSMGYDEMSFLKEAEDTLGLNLIEKSINAGKRIDRAKAAKTVAGYGAGVVGLGAVGNFLKDLIGKQ